MEPVSLEFENFMSFRECNLDFTSFSSALIIARGIENERVSNGAGKSTIFKAIEYALFGEYDADTLDEIVRWGTNQAKVIFIFKLNDKDIYRITRSRNKKVGKSDLKLAKKNIDSWEDLTQKTNSESEVELAKLIKINFNSFRNSVLFAQDDLKSLSSVKSSQDRKNILKEVLNLAIYSKLEKLSKEKANQIGKMLATIQGAIATCGTPESDICLLKQQRKTLEVDLDKLLAIKEENSQALIALKTKLSVRQKLLGVDIIELQKEYSEVIKNKWNVSISLESVSKEIQNKQNEINLQNKKIKQDEDFIGTWENDLIKLVKPNDDSLTLKKSLEMISAQIMSDRYKITALKNRNEELKKPLPEGEVCPHCLQRLDPEHRSLCRSQSQLELEQNIAQILILEEKIKSSLEEKKNIESKLQIVENYIFEQNYLTNNLQIKRSAIVQAGLLLRQMAEIQEHLSEEQAKFFNSMKDLEKEEKKLSQEINKLNVIDLTKNIENLKYEIQETENLVKSNELQIGQINTSLGINADRTLNKEDDLVKLIGYQSQLTKLEKEHYHRQLVSQSFGPTGIPAMIIHTILDDLQIEANKFLNELRPGLELQFSIIKTKADGAQEDTLHISYRIHGNELNYRLLSGGQKYMVALCLRLALSTIIQNRLGVDLKFLELDEVDEKLDEAAVDALANLLKKLQDRFKIFVITHNNQLKDKFSHAILVEYHEVDGSTAKVISQ